VPDGSFQDIVMISPLKMDIQVVRQDYGVDVRILLLETTVDVPCDNISNTPIYLSDISREYHLDPTIEDTDDILYIDKHEQTIDLSTAIEQEILIACLI